MKRSSRIKKIFGIFLAICIFFISITAFFINTYADEPSSNEEETTETEESIDIKDCDKSILHGQNWLLCSTAENASDTVSKLEGAVQELLEIGSEGYETGSEVYSFWNASRNIANVLLIIVLIVIIFSQITGVGINNYGIKKMLPKLIVMAILINLSFYICQIAVDLSNILGDGLINIFDSTTGNDSIALLGLGTASVGSATGLIASVLSITGIASFGWILIVIIVVVLAIAIGIAYLMLLVTVGLRLVIVLSFIGIAPLAFAAYILPNTNSLFKKWLDIFKGALIIYPVVSLMMGVSSIVQNIAKTSGSSHTVAMFIVRVVAAVVPYYMIPALLKKTISSLGAVGNAISKFGQNVRNSGKAIGNAARNSERARAAMERASATYNQGRVRRNGAVSLGYVNRATARGLKDEEERKEFKQLAEARVRDEDYDKKRYEELSEKAEMNKSTSALKRMKRANDNIAKVESDREALLSGANVGLSAGRIAGAREKQQLSDNASRDNLRDYRRKTYTDDKGNEHEQIWTRNSQGGWNGIDENGAPILDNDGKVATRTDDEVSKFQSVSHTEAVLNQDRINRDKSYGALGAYAVGDVKRVVTNADGTTSTTISNRINQAADAANISSLQSSTNTLSNSILQGEGEVLQVQHVKAQNEQNMVVAQAQAGVTEVSQEIALSRAQAARVASDRKVWTEQLSRADSNTVQQAFIDGLNNDDIAQAGAAFESLQATGNLPRILNALNNPDLWRNMSQEMRLELDQDMIKSGDVGMKLFAKLDFGSGNGNYAEFLSGTGNDSMGAKIAAKGSHALDGQDKDTIDFLAKNITGLLGSKSGDNFEYAGSLAKQMVSAYVSTQDGNEKKNLRYMIDEFAKNGYQKDSDQFVNAFKNAISTTALAKMDTAAIFGDPKTGETGLGPRALEILGDAIADIKKPENAQLLATMSPSVREKLGI